MSYDTIILAGDKEASININNETKALLTINGIPSIIYILNTLSEIEYIKNIFIVGPKEKLDTVINKYHSNWKTVGKNITILEQKNTVYENFWYAYNTSDKNSNKHPVFVMPGDIPLITKDEIIYFLSNANNKNYDYIAGLTPEESLLPFYPSKNTPGIRMAYLHLKEGLYRPNNLHIIRPTKIGNDIYIQKLYEIRYQKKLKNILKFIIELLKIKGTFAAIGYYILMQSALFFSSININIISKIIRRAIPLKNVEIAIGKILQTRFSTMVIPYAGASLDIDNKESYHTVNTMFDNWHKFLTR